MHEEMVCEVVFCASHCTARGLEGPAIIHQGVSQAKRDWISFCLQQSHLRYNPINRGMCGEFLMLGAKKVDVLLMWQ